MKPKTITLQFENLISIKSIVIITSITMLIVLSIFYLHPANIEWTSKDDFSWFNVLQFVFIDQLLIEFLTTYIIAISMMHYASKFKLQNVELSAKSIVLLFLKFIPLLLLVYFVIAPVTTTIRYFYHLLILQRDNLSYLDSYFFINSKIYFAYLIPILLSSVLWLTSLIISGLKINSQKIKSQLNNITLKVKTEKGERLISSSEVISIVKEGSNYMVNIENMKYQITKNLTELEEKLDHNFIKINRSTIVNLLFFKDYSFWENEKYIFRMKNGAEYNVTRERLKKIKERIEFCNTNFEPPYRV
ncbi:LytTR family DNA-binding domain-containing protein [Aquimarina gracilis]|uniref:LytTR family DNA-binding domain-containing protein n=1 Tax=Aquimarina gracilis TaxID=874422 RepID=A0ABU6A0T4_9FLAO|nr:LytTR family DNA-binding domain-containing protein [Aquimarina gracilis]MEB3347769.1 LytTR family DNA-binding domain-containing protein [Aquimarina gracilis]